MEIEGSDDTMSMHKRVYVVLHGNFCSRRFSIFKSSFDNFYENKQKKQKKIVMNYMG